MMQAIIERCCGLDVHQETLVACLLVGAPGARPTKEVRTFRTVRQEGVVARIVGPNWTKLYGLRYVYLRASLVSVHKGQATEII
jgi:hypothetical protein